MKIKQIIFLVITLLLSIGAMTIRIFQLEYAIDPTTGFYINGSSLVTYLYIAIGVFAVAIIAMLFLIKKRDIDIIIPLKKSTSFIYRISAMVAFIGLSFSAMVFFIENGVDLLAKITALEIITFALGLFLFVYIISIVFDIKYKSDNVKMTLSLAPVLWFLSCVVNAFLKHTGVANISEHIFSILMLCSLVLFFISLSKTSFVKSNNKFTFIFGLISIFACAIYIVPQIKNLLENHIESTNIILDLGTQAFNFGILLLVISILIPTKKTIKTQPSTDELQNLELEEPSI